MIALGSSLPFACCTNANRNQPKPAETSRNQPKPAETSRNQPKPADAKGREHHPWAFTSWLAGAGVKPGIVHGATDEHGLRAVGKPVHVHDFDSTILHLMGFDHEQLTYRHASRDYRLTDVEGQVVSDILA